MWTPGRLRALLDYVTLDGAGLERLRQEYFDLCFFGHGGWNHEVLDAMPVYWRKLYHAKLVTAVEEENAMKVALASGGRL